MDEPLHRQKGTARPVTPLLRCGRAALAGDRDAGRLVSMKCLIAVDQGHQAKRAYGGNAVARLQGRARDDGRPGPHLGEPPTEEQLLSSTSTRRSTTPRAARMCTMSVMPIVVCTLFVYAI